METEKKREESGAGQEPGGSAKKSRKPLIITLLCIAAAALIAGGVFLISANARKAEREQKEQERLAIVQTDVFLQGVSVGGIDISGMTMEEAKAELLYHNATLKDTLDVEIIYQDKVYPFAPAAAGITLNYEDSLAQALRPIAADGD